MVSESANCSARAEPCSACSRRSSLLGVDVADVYIGTSCCIYIYIYIFMCRQAVERDLCKHMLYMQIYVITITRLKLLSSAVSGVCVCAYVHSYGIQYNSPSQSLVNRCLCGAEEGKMGVFRMMKVFVCVATF